MLSRRVHLSDPCTSLTADCHKKQEARSWGESQEGCVRQGDYSEMEREVEACSIAMQILDGARQDLDALTSDAET